MRLLLVVLASSASAIFVEAAAAADPTAAGSMVVIKDLTERPAGVYQTAISNDRVICGAILASLNKTHKVKRPNDSIDFVLGNELSVSWNEPRGSTGSWNQTVVDLNNDGRPDTAVRHVSSLRAREFDELYWANNKLASHFQSSGEDVRGERMGAPWEGH